MNAQVVVDSEWLQDRLNDDAVVVVDVRSPQLYKQGHIPGALSLPILLLMSDRDGTPDHHQLSMRLGRAGIEPESRVVAYDDGGSPAAALFFWLLTYLGHPVVSVLNGGIAKWAHEERGWASEGRQRSPVNYRPVGLDRAALADLDEVQAGIGSNDSIILDVRSPAEYLGLQRTARRNGHIPGAINIDWQQNLVGDDDGIDQLVTDEELRRLYESAGVIPDKHIVVHCHTGVRSSETFMVLKKLGYPRVANYVAGWQEWGNRSDTPVEAK